MSAFKVVGTDYKIAKKLDCFWNTLSPEHRATLHIAFNLSNKINPTTAEECLMNAHSGRTSISSVRGDFFQFMATNVEMHPTGKDMMEAILKWGMLSEEVQNMGYLVIQ